VTSVSTASLAHLSVGAHDGACSGVLQAKLDCSFFDSVVSVNSQVHKLELHIVGYLASSLLYSSSTLCCA